MFDVEIGKVIYYYYYQPRRQISKKQINSRKSDFRIEVTLPLVKESLIIFVPGISILLKSVKKF